MAEPKRTADLVAASVEALGRYEARQESLLADKERPPAPCDVYVLRETRDYDVEWVLVARDPSTPDRFLAVPGDPNLLVGSADIALTDGSLRLRGRFAVWIDAQVLDTDLRVGTVAASDVKRVRRRWLDVGDGKTTGSVLAREVDHDPEYRDWCEDVLAPARRKLIETSGRRRGAALNEVTVLRRRSSRLKRWRIAASVALTMTGGLAMQLWRLNERAQRTEQQHREEVRFIEAARDRLEAERAHQAEAHRLELKQIAEERERLTEQHREQIATLDQNLKEARGAADVVNAAIAVFDPPEMEIRGKRELTLLPRSSHAVLLFVLQEHPPALRYRLVVRERGNDEAVWMNDGLTVEAPGEIRVGLPAAILTQGKYDLELLRLEGDAFKTLADYELTVISDRK